MPDKKPPRKNSSKEELSSCEECGAPMDERQRYCVSCGNRRKDAGSPAVQYFAGAARSKRRASSGRPGSQASSGGRAAAVIFFVLLPIAVAVGILVGRGGSEDNDELIAAIEAAGAGGGATSGTLASADAPATVASTFTLDKGFTVLLNTLPAEGTDQAAVDAAIAEAEEQGAADVGIINPADFTTKPDQGGEFIVYSGEFANKAEADKALGGLKAKFKDAVVIEVTRAAAAAGGGKVIAETQYGSVSQVEGFEATEEKEASDAPIVEDIAKKVGDDFVGAQKNLPDVIVVGGDGGGSGPSGPDN